MNQARRVLKLGNTVWTYCFHFSRILKLDFHVLKLTAADNNFGHVHCYAHLKRNVGANFKKEEKEKAQKFLEKLVYAPTVAAYESVKAEIDKELPELTTYLSSMGPELYVKSHFPFQRLGITSNSIESYWASLLNWNRCISYRF